MSYAEAVAATERGYILHILDQDTDGAINETILTVALDVIEVHLSRDALRSHLRWMESRDLVTLEVVGDAQTITGGLLIATITRRGADVATGRSSIDGVSKYRPY